MLEICQVCKKKRPIGSFLAEYNPSGQAFTCHVCLARGKVYCPVDKAVHDKSSVLQFKVGLECPERVSLLPTPAPTAVKPTLVKAVPDSADVVTQAVLTLAERIKDLTSINLEFLARLNQIQLTSAPYNSNLESENKSLREELKISKQNEETALSLAAAAEQEKTQVAHELQALQDSFMALTQARSESIKQLQDLLAEFPTTKV